MTNFEVGCYHPVGAFSECDCSECLSCPNDSRAFKCGACGTHSTMCEVCDKEFVPDDEATVCVDCLAYERAEFLADNPDYVYSLKIGKGGY